MEPTADPTPTPPRYPDQPGPDDLWAEVAAARETLDGLVALWRAQTEMSIDDARRLSVLLFNGARTVASLLFHQMRLDKSSPNDDWLDEALRQFEEERGAD